MQRQIQSDGSIDKEDRRDIILHMSGMCGTLTGTVNALRRNVARRIFQLFPTTSAVRHDVTRMFKVGRGSITVIY